MRADLDTDFFSPPHRPRVVAHRGLSGSFPENTMVSFRNAHRVRAPYLEFDVHMTRDGEVVVSHDADLHRVSGRHGLIAELTCAELAKFDAGHAFTTDHGATFPFRGQGITVP